MLHDILSSALARIGSASSLEELESVRVEVLGRKGALAGLSKEMGKLSPEERKRVGASLNAAKEQLEPAFEATKSAFETEALNARLRAEWLDLTLPASG